MAEELISVVMPAYNCENYIRKAIDSVLNQTYSNFELLIADDCSTDSTKQIIDEYTDPRIKKYHNEKNLGYLKTSNILFGKCNGNYITFQDADDYSDVTRFSKLYDFLKNNLHISAVGSNHFKIDEKNNILLKSDFETSHDSILKKFLDYKLVFTGSALMIKAEVLKKIGYYNLYFDRIGYEDYYMFSLLIENFKVSNLEDALYYYRVNSQSVSFTNKNKKSIVLHDLTLFLFKQRKLNKPDYIKNCEYSKADHCANFLLTMKSIPENKSKAIVMFIKELFVAPKIATYFYKHFIHKLFINR